MKPSIKSEIVDIVIEYDVGKNYFWHKERVQTQVNNWEKAVKEWQEEALSYTKEDIVNHYELLYTHEVILRFLKVWQDIIDKKESIIESIRYDNVITLEIFTIITGIPTKWLSNKKLKPIIKDYFYN